MPDKTIDKQSLKIGQTVWVVAKCKDIDSVLDGTFWGKNGGPGSATGYYCPYEDNCPHEDCEDFDCDKFKDTFAVFKDRVAEITLDKIGLFTCTQLCGKQQYLGEGIYKTVEEAEDALKCISAEKLDIF